MACGSLAQSASEPQASDLPQYPCEADYPRAKSAKFAKLLVGTRPRRVRRQGGAASRRAKLWNRKQLQRLATTSRAAFGRRFLGMTSCEWQGSGLVRKTCPPIFSNGQTKGKVFREKQARHWRPPRLDIHSFANFLGYTNSPSRRLLAARFVFLRNNSTFFSRVWQYGNSLTVKDSDKFHDRFLIIDQNVLIHVGASLNHLGKRCFAFASLDKSNIPDIVAKI